jgi:hypothetical protein
MEHLDAVAEIEPETRISCRERGVRTRGAGHDMGIVPCPRPVDVGGYDALAVNSVTAAA